MSCISHWRVALGTYACRADASPDARRGSETTYMKLLSLVLITVALAASPLAAQTDSGSSDTQSKGDTHIFGVLPNFATVEGDNGGAPPVTSTQKFQMATKNTFDPFVYPLVGVIAVTQRSYGSG